jgi:glycosyltransferase involved in cell wall biosynthesis
MPDRLSSSGLSARLGRQLEWLRLSSCASSEPRVPNLLYAHFGLDGLLAWPYARNLNVPLVVTLHGRDVDIRKEVYWSGERRFWQKSYPNRFAVMARQQSVHFIAVSKALLQAAIDFGVPKDRIVVCYTGIDGRQFQPSPKAITERPRRIVFVGRLVERKVNNSSSGIFAGQLGCFISRRRLPWF